ncbi:MAG TPA: kelch repeat-containing protein [Candidatus Limnocylindrales bacterium]|nr:kelch repeat-containing protein [Candidatus Limnocylindrales bacterium]
MAPAEGVATPGFPSPPNQGQWSSLPPMSVPRLAFTATLLLDGRVLIAGGRTRPFADSPDGSPTSAVEIFDPATRTFSRVPSLGTPRDGHTTTLLPSGKVLVAGGDPIGTAEIYDPVSNTWSLTARMKSRRFDHAAALISGGRVLVTGGGSAPPVGISARGSQRAQLPAEIYDPAADTWTVAATPILDRPEYPTATALRDLRVLVVGGQYLYNSPDEATETAEVYDPRTNRWSATTPETRTGARQYHTATLLPTGNVLVAGGWQDGREIAWSVLYNPITNSWTQLPNMNDTRCGHGAQMLQTGLVIVMGSGCWSGMTASAEEFDPISNRWYPVAGLAHPRGKLEAVALRDGEVLALGGGMPTNFPTAVAEVFSAS